MSAGVPPLRVNQCFEHASLSVNKELGGPESEFNVQCALTESEKQCLRPRMGEDNSDENPRNNGKVFAGITR
jgi:hypothetical protein